MAQKSRSNLLIVAAFATAVATLFSCRRDSYDCINGECEAVRGGDYLTLADCMLVCGNSGNGGSGGGSGSGADAWCSFDGTGANGVKPLYASQNIESVTKANTGGYVVVFEQPMGSANYCVTTSQYK